jgi:hypothetical protein
MKIVIKSPTLRALPFMPTNDRAPTSVHKLPGRLTASGKLAADTAGGIGRLALEAFTAWLKMDKWATKRTWKKRIIDDLQRAQCPGM